jgi:diadenosine tetraphosphate (Ap4A) HIT family hydrolase
MRIPMTLECPFCDPEQASILDQDALTFSILDAFPVSPGHTLVIPKRHVSDWFDLSEEEQVSLLRAVTRTKERLDQELHPDGYNIGINVGAAAGQTVWHVHVHVIPRYDGDVDDPRGGVRHCMPKKGYYP